MKVNLLYLCLIITVCYIKLGCSQSIVDILNDEETGNYIEKTLNDIIGTINNAVFEDDEPRKDVSNRRIQPRPGSRKKTEDSQIDKIWKEDDEDETESQPKTEPKPEPQSNPPPGLTVIDTVEEEEEPDHLIPEVNAPQEKPETTVAPKPTTTTTTTVVRTTTVTTLNRARTTEPPKIPTPQVTEVPKTYPPPPDVSKNEDEVTDGLISSKNSSNNNGNSSVPSSNSNTSNQNISSNDNNSSPSIPNNNVGNSNPQDNNINAINQNEQISPAENPKSVPVTENVPMTENENPSLNSSQDNVPDKAKNNGTIDNTNLNNNQANEANEKKKGSAFSVIVKVGIGLTVGGLCFAGLLVGRNKFKISDDNSFDNAYSFNSVPATISTNTLSKSNSASDNVMAMAPMPDNYSKNLPSNYLKPNIPIDSFPTNNEFINTDSIEPLPNLVNKVDVELPVYNIKEENYNTVGRPLQEKAAKEYNDKNELLNEGYNNIVPEMGEIVIEHTHCPSFTSSMFEAFEELDNKNNENDEDGNKMKQIIPDIRYATVEVNNEFENITMDDDVNNDNMKQIIPDIQYATVEVNNEFAGIDDDDDYSRTNSRIVVDIDANRSVTTRSSDVEELRTSDFLAISDSMDSFKSISDTYRNALRNTFDSRNRDTLSSTGSILHKFH